MKADARLTKILTLALLWLMLTFMPITRALETLVTFRDPDGNPFQQLVVHRITGSVYTGASNRVHRLSSDLTLLQSAATGPRLDNPLCPPPHVPCNETKALQDGVTKGLVIDYQEGTLLLCSTLYHGSCQKLGLQNITHVAKLIHVLVVPNNKAASSVLFTGPSIDGIEAVYVGAEYSSLGNKAYRDLVPSISSRHLSDLNFVFRDRDGGTKKAIKDDVRSSFLVQYVHGFVRGTFAYFISVQRENFQSNKLVSRIGRVCTNDKYFHSYVEIPLHCEGLNSTHYDQVLAATFHEPESKVFATFSDSMPEAWSARNSKSALCIFDVDKMDVIFNNTVQECYAGRGQVGPEHYEEPRACAKSVSITLIFLTYTSISLCW